MSSAQHAFRAVLAGHLGQTLTPELAAELEWIAFFQPGEPLDLGQFGTVLCGSLTMQAERFADILPELHALHESHWLETERHRHGLALNPDYEAVLADERRGRLLQLTARSAGRLVGNLRFYLHPGGRHTQTPFATEDTLYLAPEARNGRAAVRFIQYGERCLSKLGIREVRADAKLVNGTARLLEHLGYTPVATNFVKFLKENDHVC